MLKTDNKKGISFVRVIPFLNIEFKVKLANEELDIRDHFDLHTENAYTTFLSLIKDDVKQYYKNKGIDIPKKKVQPKGDSGWINRIFKK